MKRAPLFVFVWLHALVVIGFHTCERCGAKGYVIWVLVVSVSSISNVFFVLSLCLYVCAGFLIFVGEFVKFLNFLVY